MRHGFSNLIISNYVGFVFFNVPGWACLPGLQAFTFKLLTYIYRLYVFKLQT